MNRRMQLLARPVRSTAARRGCGRWRVAWLAAAALVAASGCKAGIGDSCQTNVECSPTGNRICDTARLGGYCTVVGCSATSCPNDSVCVSFFPAKFLPVSCNPRTEDAVTGTATDDCTIDEVCIASGQCALRAQERRFCMQPCEADSDCRTGYECRRGGTLGAEVVPDPEQPDREPKHFCAQRVVASDASIPSARSDAKATSATVGRDGGGGS